MKNIDYEVVLLWVLAVVGLISILSYISGFSRRSAINSTVAKGLLPTAAGRGATHRSILGNIWLHTGDFARSIFPILFLVVALRSFVFEHFRIPSGSMLPTLLIGDFILVNKNIYGFRLPGFRTKLTAGKQPERGDVVVFKRSVDKLNLIKRVVGLPGDRISFKQGRLFINELEVPIRADLGTATSFFLGGKQYLVSELVEQLQSTNPNYHQHHIYLAAELPRTDKYESVTVPEDSYFVLGDNRSNSDDSRVWGFVHNKDLIGKATRVLLSWDREYKDFRWSRMGQKI